MEDIRFGAKTTYNITNVAYIRVERKKGHTYEFKKGKSNMSFIYVEKGKIEYHFSDETISVNKGEALFIPKRVPYKAVYLEEGTTIKIVMFDFYTNIEIPALLKSSLNTNFKIANIFESITEDNMRDAIFLLSKAYELIYFLKLQSVHTPKKFLKIIKGLNEITKKYFENRPVSYYAKLSDTGESNFRKLFKEYTGKSPVEYRNAIRISEAKKLIESGECNVQEAAYLTGFNNMSFFYEALAKYNNL